LEALRYWPRLLKIINDFRSTDFHVPQGAVRRAGCNTSLAKAARTDFKIAISRSKNPLKNLRPGFARGVGKLSDRDIDLSTLNTYDVQFSSGLIIDLITPASETDWTSYINSSDCSVAG
jgi:hypothetical protein